MVAPVRNLTPEAGDSIRLGSSKTKSVSQTVQPIVSKIEANLVVKSSVDRKTSRIPVKKCEDRVEVKNYECKTSDKVEAVYDTAMLLKEIVDDKCCSALEREESADETLDNDIADSNVVMKKESEWSVVESRTTEEDSTNEEETAESNELAEDNIVITEESEYIIGNDLLKTDESEDDIEDTIDYNVELPEENTTENFKCEPKTDNGEEITIEETMKDKEEVEKVSSLKPEMESAEEWDKLMTQTVRLGMGCLLAYLLVNMWWDYKDGKYFK